MPGRGCCEPHHFWSLLAEPPGAPRLGWGVAKAASSPHQPPGGQLWASPAPHALYCRQRPHSSRCGLTPEKPEVLSGVLRPRVEATGYPHPCLVPTFLQPCSLTPSRPGRSEAGPRPSSRQTPPRPRPGVRGHTALPPPAPPPRPTFSGSGNFSCCLGLRPSGTGAPAAPARRGTAVALTAAR